MQRDAGPDGRPRSAWLYFALVGALAIPLWLASDRLGVVTSLRIPASDLGLAFTPMIAALVLVGIREGWPGAFALLGRAFDVRTLRGWRWRIVTLLLAPALYGSAAVVMRALGGDAAAPVPLARLALLFALFLVLAAGEEVGWTGYALGPLQARFGPLGASVILAVPWWLGHLPSMQAIGATASDIAWWALAAVALRVLFTWLYNGAGGSLCAAVVFHALLNLSRIVAYPATGSHYDSAYQAAGSAIAAVAALAVVRSLRRQAPPRGA